jgi:lipoprotein NlpI
MSQNTKIALLTLVSLVCMTTENIFAQEAHERTAGMPVQSVSLGDVFSQTNADLARNAKKSLKGDMLSEKTYYDRGVLFVEKGHYDLALLEFNKALEIYPLSAQIYNARGILYSRKGQHDLAITDFSTAIKIKPDDAQTYYNRGITYVISGQFELAILDFNKCLGLNPSHAMAYDARGSVYANQACSDWEQACRLRSCDHLKLALKAGLCIESIEDTTRAP